MAVPLLERGGVRRSVQCATITVLAGTAMLQFAVFFSDGGGFGIEMVQAMDQEHALDISRARHATGRLSTVPAELLDGLDRHRLLMAWIEEEG